MQRCRMKVNYASIQLEEKHLAAHTCFTCLLCPQDIPGKNTGVSCHFPPQGNLPNPGIKHTSPASLALAGRFFTTALPGKPMLYLFSPIS